MFRHLPNPLHTSLKVVHAVYCHLRSWNPILHVVKPELTSLPSSSKVTPLHGNSIDIGTHKTIPGIKMNTWHKSTNHGACDLTINYTIPNKFLIPNEDELIAMESIGVFVDRGFIFIVSAAPTDMRGQSIIGKSHDISGKLAMLGVKCWCNVVSQKCKLRYRNRILPAVRKQVALIIPHGYAEIPKNYL